MKVLLLSREIVAKGKIAHHEQFWLLPHCFKRRLLWIGQNASELGNAFTCFSTVDMLIDNSYIRLIGSYFTW